MSKDISNSPLCDLGCANVSPLRYDNLVDTFSNVFIGFAIFGTIKTSGHDTKIS